MERLLKAEKFNPIDMMVGSGARGNMMQVKQIAGMRGLVANPRGDMIPRPIKSNFREGLSMLEYFIATPGARKGLVDTALRTADSGYLTRRLVDVAQELIIREPDCGTNLGIWVEHVVPDTPQRRAFLDTKLLGRSLITDMTLADGTVLEAGPPLSMAQVEALRDDPNVDRVRVRSVLTCEAKLGICGTCYGLSLATGKDIEMGEAVGVIAAQSIGEPGTQLTMRTFHTGGVAGQDIAGGLPRVVELFEARTPRGKAVLVPLLRCRAHRAKTRARAARSRSWPTTAPRTRTSCRARAASAVVEGQEVRAGDALVGDDKTPAIRRSSSRSRASARRSSTWSKRCRRCTATRVCRSTTSTSS